MTANGSDRVVRRVVATGTLKLLGPAHFGAGESRDADMAPVLDADGDPFLPGTSIAGCVYSYLSRSSTDARALMALYGTGGSKDDPADQSLICFDDVYFNSPTTEHRDGVAIEPTTGTAARNRKFDLQVLSPGATGDISIEVTLREKNSGDGQSIEIEFQRVLNALADGSVRMGARTRRGYGRVIVDAWKIRDYLVGTSVDHALAWLSRLDPPGDVKQQLTTAPPDGGHPSAVMTVALHLDSSLLVRSAPPEQQGKADFVHLRSGGKPVIPGTSWAGVLRGRAIRILNTLGKSTDLVECMFGPLHKGELGDSGESLYAGRVTVDESVVIDTAPVLQTRIKINRFTGGTSRGALFEEQAEWPTNSVSANTTLRIELEKPERHEIALLFLLVKDLTTGDLPVGGGAGIGRGLMSGIGATLQTPDGDWKWSQTHSSLEFEKGSAADLEKTYGEAWRQYLAETPIAEEKTAHE